MARQKTPEISDSQRKVWEASKRAQFNGHTIAKNDRRQRPITVLNSVRAMWKKGWVTPVSLGEVDTWTFWRFTDKFYRDFPEYRAPEPTPEDQGPEPTLEGTVESMLRKQGKL
jgi:hypothetical protein